MKDRMDMPQGYLEMLNHQREMIAGREGTVSAENSVLLRNQAKIEMMSTLLDQVIPGEGFGVTLEELLSIKIPLMQLSGRITYLSLMITKEETE